MAPHAVAADVALAAVRRLVARHDHRDVQLGDAERAVLVGVEGRVVDVGVGGRDGVDAELGLRGVVVVAEVRVVVGELQPADHPVVGHAGALGGRHEGELPEAVGLVVAGDAAGAEEVLGPLVLGAADAGLVGEGHQDDQAGLRAVARAGRPSGCPGLGGGPSGAGTLDDLRPQPARGGRRRGLADLEVGSDGPSRGVEPDGVPPGAGGVLRDGVAALGLVAAGARVAPRGDGDAGAVGLLDGVRTGVDRGARVVRRRGAERGVGRDLDDLRVAGRGRRGAGRGRHGGRAGGAEGQDEPPTATRQKGARCDHGSPSRT